MAAASTTVAAVPSPPPRDARPAVATPRKVATTSSSSHHQRHYSPSSLGNSKPSPVKWQMTDSEFLKANKCAILVGKLWRGVRTRRQLKSEQLFKEYLKKKWIHVQCFFRVTKARLVQRRRREALAAALQARTAAYHRERVEEINGRMRWERKNLEAATIKVQKWYRWLKRKAAAQSQGGAVEPFPLPLPRKVWLASPEGDGQRRAWAPKAAPVNASGRQGPPKSSRDIAVTPSPPSKVRRRIRDYESVDPLVGVYTESEILYLNNIQREREQRQMIRKEESRPLRQPSNALALVSRDLDACAVLVQRRFRLVRAAEDVSTRKEYSLYLRKHAVVIQCAWRSYRSRVRRSRVANMKASLARTKTRGYHDSQVQRITSEIKWNRHTLERAAQVIQRGWRWSRDKVKGGSVAASLPSKPPVFELLDDTRVRTKRRLLPKTQAQVAEAAREEAAASPNRQRQADSTTAPSPAASQPAEAPTIHSSGNPPSLSEGRAALHNIAKQDVREMQAYAVPPKAVRQVVEAALVAAGKDHAGEWNAARGELRSSDFIGMLQRVEPATMSAKHKERLKQIVAAPGFTQKAARHASKAAECLFLWALSVSAATAAA